LCTTAEQNYDYLADITNRKILVPLFVRLNAVNEDNRLSSKTKKDGFQK